MERLSDELLLILASYCWLYFDEAFPGARDDQAGWARLQAQCEFANDDVLRVFMRFTLPQVYLFI
jgi:hypothetical protein